MQGKGDYPCTFAEIRYRGIRIYGKSLFWSYHLLLYVLNNTQSTIIAVSQVIHIHCNDRKESDVALNLTDLYTSISIIFCIIQEHMIQSEVSILRRVKHPNIVLLIEEMDTLSELYLVMELVKVPCIMFNAKIHSVLLNTF